MGNNLVEIQVVNTGVSGRGTMIVENGSLGLLSNPDITPLGVSGLAGCPVEHDLATLAVAVDRVRRTA